jgi:hypothetical protein
LLGCPVLAMLVSQRIVARHRAADPGPGLSRAQVSSVAYRGAGPMWPIRFASDVAHYLVMRSRSAFGWFHMEHAEAGERTSQAEPLVAARLECAELAARLRGEPPPELPARTRQNLARLTPRI